MNKEEFNGYDFDNIKARKKMKYIVISRGDLDLNGAYAFKSMKEVKEYVKGIHHRGIFAIFKVKDLTNKLKINA